MATTTGKLVYSHITADPKVCGGKVCIEGTRITVKDIVAYKMPDKRPLDGEDILPILSGDAAKRKRAIPFSYASGKSSLVKGSYKLMLPSRELYHLEADRSEEKDLAKSMPEKVVEMERELIEFFKSVKKSHAGGDYNDPSYKPWNKGRKRKLK